MYLQPTLDPERCVYRWLWWQATCLDIVDGKVTGPMRGALEAWGLQ